MNKIIGILCLLIVFACNTKKAQKAETTTDISGRWELQSIKLTPQDEIIIPTKEYWIEMKDGQFNFNKETNTCRGQLELLKNNRIAIKSPFACTKMCCDKDISDQLTYGDVTNYTIKKNKLTLIAPDRKFELIKTERPTK